ncbi:unnamed protein product [Amoebophrya sp. A120]|nr:unnamed protein product [Amoebophrya sp. A120]|eukprot:GSA120T00023994001.1
MATLYVELRHQADAVGPSRSASSPSSPAGSSGVVRPAAAAGEVVDPPAEAGGAARATPKAAATGNTNLTTKQENDRIRNTPRVIRVEFPENDPRVKKSGQQRIIEREALLLQLERDHGIPPLACDVYANIPGRQVKEQVEDRFVLCKKDLNADHDSDEPHNPKRPRSSGSTGANGAMDAKGGTEAAKAVPVAGAAAEAPAAVKPEEAQQPAKEKKSYASKIVDNVRTLRGMANNMFGTNGDAQDQLSTRPNSGMSTRPSTAGTAEFPVEGKIVYDLKTKHLLTRGKTIDTKAWIPIDLFCSAAPGDLATQINSIMAIGDIAEHCKAYVYLRLWTESYGEELWARVEEPLTKEDQEIGLAKDTINQIHKSEFPNNMLQPISEYFIAGASKNRSHYLMQEYQYTPPTAEEKDDPTLGEAARERARAGREQLTYHEFLRCVFLSTMEVSNDFQNAHWKDMPSLKPMQLACLVYRPLAEICRVIGFGRRVLQILINAPKDADIAVQDRYKYLGRTKKGKPVCTEEPWHMCTPEWRKKKLREYFKLGTEAGHRVDFWDQGLTSTPIQVYELATAILHCLYLNSGIFPASSTAATNAASSPVSLGTPTSTNNAQLFPGAATSGLVSEDVEMTAAGSEFISCDEGSTATSQTKEAAAATAAAKARRRKYLQILLPDYARLVLNLVAEHKEAQRHKQNSYNRGGNNRQDDEQREKVYKSLMKQTRELVEKLCKSLPAGEPAAVSAKASPVSKAASSAGASKDSAAGSGGPPSVEQTQLEAGLLLALEDAPMLRLKDFIDVATLVMWVEGKQDSEGWQKTRQTFLKVLFKRTANHFCTEADKVIKWEKKVKVDEVEDLCGKIEKMPPPFQEYNASRARFDKQRAHRCEHDRVLSAFHYEWSSADFFTMHWILDVDKFGIVTQAWKDDMAHRIFEKTEQERVRRFTTGGQDGWDQWCVVIYDRIKERLSGAQDQVALLSDIIQTGHQNFSVTLALKNGNPSYGDPATHYKNMLRRDFGENIRSIKHNDGEEEKTSSNEQQMEVENMDTPTNVIGPQLPPMED